MGFRNVKVGSAVPMVDLIHRDNARFLGSIATLGENDEFLENAYYAAGQVYTTTSLDSMLAQAFYNPIVAQIVERMSKGGLFSAEIGRYCPEFVGKTFAELFNFMLGNDCLAFALYKKSKASRLNYVVTNPLPSTILSQEDFVFVYNKSVST